MPTISSDTKKIPKARRVIFVLIETGPAFFSNVFFLPFSKIKEKYLTVKYHYPR
jgi:hypothetical protein